MVGVDVGEEVEEGFVKVRLVRGEGEAGRGGGGVGRGDGATMGEERGRKRDGGLVKVVDSYAGVF